jgi:RNA polymerase sigma-70 factor (ECF subfamily)
MERTDPAIRRHRQQLQEDLDLARRCRAGDQAARTELVKRHLDQVQLTLFRIVGPSQEMTDLVQTALLEVLRSLRSYRGDALLRTWVDRVCANVAYQHLRKSNRPAPVLLAVVPDIMDGDHPVGERGEAALRGRRLLTRLTRLLDGLEPRKRIALILHAVQGYSVREVAAMTDSRVSTTKSRIMYGRRELLRRARQDPELRDWLDHAGSPTSGEDME